MLGLSFYNLKKGRQTWDEGAGKAMTKDRSNNEVCGSIYCLVLLTLPVFVAHCSLQVQERKGESAEVNVYTINVLPQREGVRHGPNYKAGGKREG